MISEGYSNSIQCSLVFHMENVLLKKHVEATLWRGAKGQEEFHKDPSCYFDIAVKLVSKGEHKLDEMKISNEAASEMGS